MLQISSLLPHRYAEMVRKHREFEAREKKEKRRRIKLLNDMPGFLEKRQSKLGSNRTMLTVCVYGSSCLLNGLI